AGNTVHVILPLTTQIATVAGASRGAVLIFQNPTANPVDVRVFQTGPGGSPSSTLIPIAAGATQTANVNSFAAAQALAAQPLRMGLLINLNGPFLLTQAPVPDSATFEP